VVIVEQSIVDVNVFLTILLVTDDRVEHVIVEPTRSVLLNILLVDKLTQFTFVPDSVVNENDPALIVEAKNVEFTVRVFVVTVLPNNVENPIDLAESVLPLKVELLILPENMVDPESVEKVNDPVLMVEPNIVE